MRGGRLGVPNEAKDRQAKSTNYVVLVGFLVLVGAGMFVYFRSHREEIAPPVPNPPAKGTDRTLTAKPAVQPARSAVGAGADAVPQAAQGASAESEKQQIARMEAQLQEIRERLEAERAAESR